MAAAGGWARRLRRDASERGRSLVCNVAVVVCDRPGSVGNTQRASREWHCVQGAGVAQPQVARPARPKGCSSEQAGARTGILTQCGFAASPFRGEEAGRTSGVGVCDGELTTRPPCAPP